MRCVYILKCEFTEEEKIGEKGDHIPPPPPHTHTHTSKRIYAGASDRSLSIMNSDPLRPLWLATLFVDYE